jgi:hypothetical protein
MTTTYNDNDPGDGDNHVAMPKEVFGSVGQSLVKRSGSDATKVKGMSNRFAFAKKYSITSPRYPFARNIKCQACHYLLCHMRAHIVLYFVF